ncbi:hypothetical protein JCM5353_001089 [Sporobolomyces roseus]
MRSSLAAYASPFILAATLVNSAITPTSPGGGTEVFVAGQECSFEWEADSTGTWKSFDVDLMSGSNFEMVNVTRVAVGIDGTSGETKHSFRCPEVEPPAPIYFYQFTLDNKDPLWTQRFTITANGSIVEASNATQPDGTTPVPWGVGSLVNNSETTSSAVAALTSPEGEESIVSAAWGILSGDEDQVESNSSAPINGTLANSTESTLQAGLSQTPTATALDGQWDPSSVANGQWQGQASTPTSSWNESTATSSVSHNITGFMQGPSCDIDNQCPEETPCCSEQRQCGTGRNCLAGCNPLTSFQPQACAPVPACVDQEYSLNTWSANRILQNSSTWNGDASSIDWLVDRSVFFGNSTLGFFTANSTTGNSSLTLSLTPESNGTTITSTRSILYGNVTARVKSVAGAGIVTSFSLLSGVEDEVSFEFTTNSTEIAHSAFYYQRETNDFESLEQLNVSDRSLDFHDYTISWLPETITWLVDGVAVRNVSKNSTSDGEAYHYPQTPSRIRFSIYDGGSMDPLLAVNEFSGGSVDYNSTDFVETGYVSSYVSSVNVLCYPASLLANFSFANSSTVANSSSEYNVSSLTNGTSISDSTIPLNGTNFTESSSASAVESKSSSTIWWSAPTPSPQVAAVPSQQEGTAPSSEINPSAQSWWAPPARRLRRWIQLVKRDESILSAYSYGPVDENGQIGVSGWEGSTVIASDAATGLNSKSSLFSCVSNLKLICICCLNEVLATVPTSEQSTGGSSPVPSNPNDDTTEDDSEESEGKSRMDKWNDLPTAAHVGIIGGAAVVGLLLVVIIGRCCWKRASSSSKEPTAKYAPIGDQGGFDGPSGPVTTYASTNGMLYDPNVSSTPPVFATQVVTPQAQPQRRASSASISSTNSKYTNGGYVPSSSLRKDILGDGKSRV